MKELRNDITLFCAKHKNANINKDILKEYINNNNFIIRDTEEISPKYCNYFNEFVFHWWIYKHIDEIDTPFIGMCQYRYLPDIEELNNLGELNDTDIITKPYWLTNEEYNFIDFPFDSEFIKRLFTETELNTIKDVIFSSIPNFEHFKNKFIINNRETFICSKESFKEIIRFTTFYMIQILKEMNIKNFEDIKKHIRDIKEIRKFAYFCEYLISIKIYLMVKYEGYNQVKCKHLFL